MKVLSLRVLRALERFNAAYPWDHNAHYHRWILRQLPRRSDRALDVGSGSGDLARLLARRAATVTAVDSGGAASEVPLLLPLRRSKWTPSGTSMRGTPSGVGFCWAAVAGS
ncbi:hypothetical protein GCM10010344_00780 [Streptomyces bluensis]|nr:hypothetical protein GCM10010344_00780 [Streptomyces bluensis]